MVFILITATASVAVYLAISLRFLGSIVSNDGLPNHTPPVSWAEFHPPTCITSRCQTLDSEHSPYLGETLIKRRRIQHTYYYRMYFVHNFSLFVSEGKKIILRVEGTDALHQEAVTEKDGFITIIVGASLLAYFLGVLCSCLVYG